MKETKTETWVYPTNREILADYWNAMLKRWEQISKWKQQPSKKRFQKELSKITDKYADKILRVPELVSSHKFEFTSEELKK